MNKNTLHKIIAIWLLLVMFVMSFAFKVVHVYQSDCRTESSCSDKSASGHNPATCSICQFTLSDFSKPELFHSYFILPEFSFLEPVTYQDKIFVYVFSHNYLRGPPSV